MDDLAYTLRVLCQRNRDGSHATQADRLRSLTLASRQLREAGFRQMRAGSLKGKHVQVLLRRRQDEGLSAGTLKNRVAHLRWWAEKVGKAGLIPADNACLAIPDRRFVTNEDKARELGDSLARIGDPYVRASLALQQVFGLRREEAIKFQPSYADQGDRIMLKGSWTKGGRSREVPITTPEQRAVLDQAHRIAVFAIPTAANTSAGGVRRPIGSRIGRNPCESFQTRCLRGHRPARASADSDKRLKSGGKARYLLSGLLVCKVCKAHYVIADARSYACSGHWRGGACSNDVRVRRDAIECVILGGIYRDLLEPERVARMADEMRAAYAERIRALAARAAVLPRELEELDARIMRLRERLKAGDPDLTPEELLAAIDRAEAKRRQVFDVQPTERENARILAMLPRTAELYREQIDQGLGGDPAASAKARTILRDMLGEVMLSPGEGGSLWAEYAMQPAALLTGAGAGTGGRGDRI